MEWKLLRRGDRTAPVAEEAVEERMQREHRPELSLGERVLHNPLGSWCQELRKTGRSVWKWTVSGVRGRG